MKHLCSIGQYVAWVTKFNTTTFFVQKDTAIGYSENAL